MSRIEAPCLNCKDRERLCHASCERYKAYKEALVKRNCEIKRQRAKESMITEFIVENTKRTQGNQVASEHVGWRKDR